MGLKIGDTPLGAPLRPKLFSRNTKLLGNRQSRGGGKIATSAVRAVYTTAASASAVYIRASESRIKWDLCTLAAEGTAQIVIVGVISFIRVAVLKGVQLPLR